VDFLGWWPFDLNVTWFILVGALLTGYAMLDGFDLGVGGLHLLAKTDEERRIMLNSIGPVWDGNEVWLVTGGGALFAAFPHVYATVFSGFYMAFMLLLFSLIFRAVAIEFRSKQPMGWWRQLWDVSFSIASILSALLIGVAIGNIAWGVPIGADKEFVGNFWTLIHPYSLVVGVLTLTLFLMHGAIYVAMKTEGDLQKRVRGWVKVTMIVFIVCYLVTTISTLLFVPHLSAAMKLYPLLYIVWIVNLLAVANIPREIAGKRDGAAFISSCIVIVSFMAMFGINIFPNLVYSTLNPEWSLTVYNAASSQTTLAVMFNIACLGMPLVIAYTICIYWIFRGKVKLDASSY